MVSAVDTGNALLLTKAAFNTAMGWLLEAEAFMPEIFKAGGVGADSKAMDEIYHYILASDLKRTGVNEHKVVNFARERLPAHSVMRALDVMERSGTIRAISIDKATGQRMWQVVVEAKD